MDYPGNLFAVAAPERHRQVEPREGAAGARFAPRRLDLAHHPQAPRPGAAGREYHFVDEPEFRPMIDAGQFVEWAEVHGNLYGTSRGAIEERIVHGQDVVLEIDWQGALQIKRLFPNAILIFLLPPSWDELLQRLQRRGEDDPQVIAQRMENARIEVSQARHFDFVIINALFESALFDLKAIVHSQRLKYASLLRAKPASSRHSTCSDVSLPSGRRGPVRKHPWPASPSKTASSRSRTASSWCSPRPIARAC
jgi:guanylate kinase